MNRSIASNTSGYSMPWISTRGWQILDDDDFFVVAIAVAARNSTNASDRATSSHPKNILLEFSYHDFLFFNIFEPSGLIDENFLISCKYFICDPKFQCFLWHISYHCEFLIDTQLRPCSYVTAVCIKELKLTPQFD